MIFSEVFEHHVIIVSKIINDFIDEDIMGDTANDDLVDDTS